MVRSPVTSKVVSPAWRTPVEAKVIFGYSCMARKSLLRRCSSRWALRVSMLAASIVTSTRELAGVRAIQHRGARELVKRAAHLGHHGMAGDEADAGVRGVEGVGAGQFGQGRDGSGGHRNTSR